MEMKDIENHWKSWASEFGIDIRATDMSKTKKALEIDALTRAILKSGYSSDTPLSVLEVGCGTGHNCLAIKSKFPNAVITGIDYIPEMVNNAVELSKKCGVFDIVYAQGNVLSLNEAGLNRSGYDVVFTNRCIINLNTQSLQNQAVLSLAKQVKKGGVLVLMENPQHKFETQNRLRATLGLPAREVPSFNRFVDEDAVIDSAKSGGLVLSFSEDFSSLHDLILYVLLPSINGGKIDYESELVQAAQKLSLTMDGARKNSFGCFGQNRLYLFKK